MAEIKKNEIYEVRIEDMGHDGAGIGKIDGYPLFVKDALIGDVAEVKIIKAKKNYAYARLMHLITPSPHRVTPRCPVARQCGGCQIQALDYGQQLLFKKHMVENNLRRIGGLTDVEVLPVLGMDVPYRYRNKAQFPIGTDKDGNPVAGFYAGRTHSIIPCKDCILGEAVNAEILSLVLDHMKKYHIPTAAYETFTDPEKALEYLETAKMPIVLKADGLALGKGVLICQTLEEAKEGVKTLMMDKKFGSAGDEIVIEEFMTGREVSVLSFVDGNIVKIMSSAQDHKRAKDGDQGLNTGGMGNFSPSPFYTEEVDEFCKKYIYQPTVDAMKAEGRPFKGVIFFGLMLTPEGPKVLEYNARFGDPEAQVVLPRLENDIVDVFEACIDGTLDKVDLKFDNDRATVCVILASDGYPVEYKKGFPIEGLEKFKGKDDYYVFHSGTKFNDKGQIVTNGGRVLGVTATGKDLKEARKKAYEATEWVSFENKYMRHDIGRAIDEA